MCAKGRGPQIHAGALAAKGDILLFLHADARLPRMARAAILRRLSDPDIVGGNFLLKFLPSSWFTRFLAPFNDLRRFITRRYYGDSGIFVRREVYHRLGGFLSYPLMEDYDFSTKLQRAGRCVYIRDIWVTASDRRFRGKELRTLLLWMSLQVLYWLRVPPHILYKAYPDVRGDELQRFIDAYRQQFEENFRLGTVPLA